ncbi:hypothetical protein C1H76_3092 [Elsinoe australis]|uniref:Uncharacterized protein n=1 Tax=Elsinoe australis TaxID=40998 RepID=A0A4U7B456_9PEZI|nr:hypothetical protein C1H76_3092 [Elsinoe australis]
MAASQTAIDLSKIEARLTTNLSISEKNNVLKIHEFIITSPLNNNGDLSIERARIRDAPGLHVTRGTGVGSTVINSRMGVISSRTGLVNRDHKTEDAHGVAPTVDSRFTAADLGFSEQEWIWLCIPGTYNPWLKIPAKGSKQTPRTPRKRKSAFIDEEEDDNEAASCFPTPEKSPTPRNKRRCAKKDISYSDESAWINENRESKSSSPSPSFSNASANGPATAANTSATTASSRTTEHTTATSIPAGDDTDIDNDKPVKISGSTSRYPSYFHQDPPPYSFHTKIARDNYDHTPNLILDPPKRNDPYHPFDLNPRTFLTGISPPSSPNDLIFNFGSPPPSPKYNDPSIWPDYQITDHEGTEEIKAADREAAPPLLSNDFFNDAFEPAPMLTDEDFDHASAFLASCKEMDEEEKTNDELKESGMKLAPRVEWGTMAKEEMQWATDSQQVYGGDATVDTSDASDLIATATIRKTIPELTTLSAPAKGSDTMLAAEDIEVGWPGWGEFTKALDEEGMFDWEKYGGEEGIWDVVDFDFVEGAGAEQGGD